jgi:cell pole-organizing protein PopZ
LLKRWLDENLPGLIERLVRQEIEKMVGRLKDRSPARGGFRIRAR